MWIGVGHDDSVICESLISAFPFRYRRVIKLTFGSKVRLDPLSVGASSIKNMLSRLVASDKRDCFDAGFVTNEIDGIYTSVNDIQDTFR